MRYTSNDLDAFALHDACVEEVIRDGADLRLRLSDANVLEDCPANPHGCGMCVAEMWLTFERGDLRAATVWASQSYDPVTQIRTELPQRSIPAEDRWQALCETLYIYSAQKQADEGGKRAFLFSMSSARDGGLMDFEFLADGIRFEWDEFAGPAWFEKSRPDRQ